MNFFSQIANVELNIISKSGENNKLVMSTSKFFSKLVTN